MPRDPRTFITVHDGMPEHPLVLGLADDEFRDLVCAFLRGEEGGLIDELRAADVVRGPFEERLTRPKIPDDLRFAVYERDGYRCVTCGASSDLSLDHIYPWSLGGEDTADNLQTMCRPCNSRKGARIGAEDPRREARLLD